MPQDDAPLTLSEAARSSHLPRPVAPSTIFRWHRPGILAANGQRVRLRAERYGGRLYVRPSAIRDFATRLADADAAADAEVEARQVRPLSTPTPSEDDRHRRLATARDQLAQA